MNRLFHFDTKLSELSMTQFKLFMSPSGGMEVGYFLLRASLAKLAIIKRCTNPSFIAISGLNCAEHLLSLPRFQPGEDSVIFMNSRCRHIPYALLEFHGTLQYIWDERPRRQVDSVRIMKTPLCRIVGDMFSLLRAVINDTDFDTWIQLFKLEHQSNLDSRF